MTEPGPSPSPSPHLRWMILCMSCISMTGCYYSFDIPAALHQQLKDYMSNNPTSNNYAVNFNLLYSVYSIPNIILPFFGGTIVDSLGAHTCTLLFATLTLLGQIAFAIGVTHKSWGIMLLGRTIYGLGGENLSVATSTLNSKWFQGKELALSFGINLAVSRMGSVVNNWISPTLANRDGMPVAIWFGVGMNLLSVLCAAVICVLTRWKERAGDCLDDRDDDLMHSAGSLTDPLLGDVDDHDHDQHDLSLNDEEPHDGDENEERCTSTSTIDHFVSSDDSNEPMQVDDVSLSQSDASTVITANRINDTSISTSTIMPTPTSTPTSMVSSLACLHHVQTFGTMFWLLSASCIVVYGCVLPFNNIASGILLERNYFTKPSSDLGSCTLKYPNECTSGSLAPYNGNPAMNSDGSICTIEENSQPFLPTSIHLHIDEHEKIDANGEGNASPNVNEQWDHDSYNFDHLSEDDIDCGDDFWKYACTKNFCSAQDRATEISGRIMSIPYILSATLSPFCGHIVDKIGFRAIIASAASLILICVHLSLALTNSSPVLPLAGQGLAYTCYAAVIWPSVPLTVAEDSVGTAFGAITAIQNFGLAVFPLIIASIYTASGESYIPNVEYFFVVCAVLGTGIGVLLNVHDRRKGGILNNR